MALWTSARASARSEVAAAAPASREVSEATKGVSLASCCFWSSSMSGMFPILPLQALYPELDAEPRNATRILDLLRCLVYGCSHDGRFVPDGCRRVASVVAGQLGGLGNHRSTVRIPGEAPSGRNDHPAQTEQVFEQSVVSSLPKCALSGPLCRSLSRSQARLAFLPVQRSRDRLHRQAGCRGGRVQVLEAAHLGQADHRDGLPLPLPIRDDSLFRKGQATPE